MTAPASPGRPGIDLILLGALRLGVSALLLSTGFYAVSDDDFSRVVIAQSFAAAPRLDPSGTSWLPLPFWVTGSVMSVAGRSLEVARGVALSEAILAVLLVHRAALWLGATRLGAFLSAAMAAVLPAAARLGTSFQPELLTAGLIVLGAAGGAVAAPGRQKTLGAIALAGACLCRYEAWPAAATFAALTVWDHTRSPATPGRLALLPAAIAVSTPALWLLHGAWNHGRPLFFVGRVAAFRRALGESEPLATALTAYPRALLDEPELLLGALAIFIGARHAHVLRQARAPESIEHDGLRQQGRFALILSSILLFLAVGRVLDGAPTHHAARTLLALWLGLAVVAVAQALRLPRVAVGLGLVATTGLGLGLRTLGPAEAFADRAAERTIGELAREKVPEGARLAIDTPDYGYFAVMAAFRESERATPLQNRDPRVAALPDAFRSADTLRARLHELEAGWFIAERAHFAVALRVGEPQGIRGRFALLRVLH